MSDDKPIYTKPFLKWAGNKFRIIDRVIGYIEEYRANVSSISSPSEAPAP